MTSTTVTAHGWNSCGGWFKTGGTFENYCPFCHRHGTLRFNPKGTSEGEWTCTACDADYCLCGKCKAGGSHVYLIKTSKPAVVAKKLQPVSSPSSSTGQSTTANTGINIMGIGIIPGNIIGHIDEPFGGLF